ncbi:MAG: EAL and HDOD domain-containing protein [Clostridium sp.]|uniref:EAL and HDOD domain-containing protein n=1 Tax=Clostridium sp. TaxID=1506 RepID=UPI003F3236B7
MNVFFAKQAIYNSDKEIVAYELLHRNSYKNEFDKSIEENEATYKIINTISNLGIKEIVKNKRAFINFPEKAILSEMFKDLPKENIVLEILENVVPTSEIIKKICELKDLGYVIALDDVSKSMNYKKFLSYIDIYKIDFTLTTKEERLEILNYIRSVDYNAKFLAEKIENREEYEEALKEKYEYYQGFYFSKPIIVDKEIKEYIMK